MRQKLSVLRACRQVLRPGGRLAFLSIQPSPGLAPDERRKANKLGPTAVAVPTSYPSLLVTAGFDDAVATDVTAEYRATQQRWIDATERQRPGIVAAIGEPEYADRVLRRRGTLDAIDAGLLARFLYTARR